MSIITKPYLELLKPLKIVKSVELANSAQYFTKKVALFTTHLLFENGEGCILVEDIFLSLSF